AGAHLRSRRPPRGRHPTAARSVAGRSAYLPADAQAMTMPGRRFLRRWLVAFAIAASLIATASAQARAQQGNIADLLFAGRNVDAIELVKRAFEPAPAGECQAAFQRGARVCVILLDLDC